MTNIIQLAIEVLATINTLNSRGASGSVPVSMTYTLDDDSDGSTSLLRHLLESPKQLKKLPSKVI